MDQNDNVLLIDEEYSPILIEDECVEFKPILRDFIKGYSENKDQPVEIWLGQKMQEHLPDRSADEIREMTEEIISTLKVDERNKASLEDAVSNGISKESWFASETAKATSAMSTQEASKYLARLDDALKSANEVMYKTVTTQAGAINKNPHLDGFIAEQYHVQSFNLNAEATGSKYRAKVLTPEGKAYARNSVDIGIYDTKSGKLVKKYQSKYYADAKATEKAFAKGDYRGQRGLVPSDQADKITKKVTSVLEAPDGVKSNPLARKEAKQMSSDVQSGKQIELDWNEFSTRDVALGIGKQAGFAALQGAAIGVGLDVAQKLWNGEEIEADEVIETALVSGTDFGIKASAAGALKVGIEKEIITVIPKGTPASACANIAYVAVENMKVLGKIMTGEYSFREGIDKIEQNTVATVAGLTAMEKGAVIGAAAGAFFGPVGAAVGGFIGGTVGYIAGSKVGEAVVKGSQMIRDGVVEVAKSVAGGIAGVVSGVVSAAGSIFSGVASLFGF